MKNDSGLQSNPIHRLELYVSTSRGQDTYGWTIVGLVDENGTRFRTCGGGYDMRGTVLGDYFTSEHQAALQDLVAGLDLEPCNYAVEGYKKSPAHYGLTVNPQGQVSLDGGCGINCIESIIRACGYGIDYAVDRRGNVKTYYLQYEGVNNG